MGLHRPWEDETMVNSFNEEQMYKVSSESTLNKMNLLERHPLNADRTIPDQVVRD